MQFFGPKTQTHHLSAKLSKKHQWVLRKPQKTTWNLVPQKGQRKKRKKTRNHLVDYRGTARRAAAGLLPRNLSSREAKATEFAGIKFNRPRKQALETFVKSLVRKGKIGRLKARIGEKTARKEGNLLWSLKTHSNHRRSIPDWAQDFPQKRPKWTGLLRIVLPRKNKTRKTSHFGPELNS